MKLPIQHRIQVAGDFWDFGRKILDAVQIEDRVLVIFDYMEFPRRQQARNLEAYSLQKEQLWVAEHPTDQSPDTYVHFISESPLRVCNFASYTCTIDVKTGKIIEALFTK